MLAMACAGAHGRAAALACEIFGIHPGLRSFDSGLAVLGRHLNQRQGWGGRGAEMEMEWFSPSLQKLREKAWCVYEADLL